MRPGVDDELAICTKDPFVSCERVFVERGLGQVLKDASGLDLLGNGENMLSPGQVTKVIRLGGVSGAACRCRPRTLPRR